MLARRHMYIMCALEAIFNSFVKRFRPPTSHPLQGHRRYQSHVRPAPEDVPRSAGSPALCAKLPNSRETSSTYQLRYSINIRYSQNKLYIILIIFHYLVIHITAVRTPSGLCEHGQPTHSHRGLWALQGHKRIVPYHMLT